MRIIAGSRRGMKLVGPGSWGSRPVTDRVKESLFSVLYGYGLPAGKVTADLFCGVGSLGLECLSRAAEFVTFVEQDSKTLAVLERNIEKAGFADRSKVIRADAFKVGAPVDADRGKCELVFVDPPYAKTRQSGVGSALAALLDVVSRQVAPAGFVVVRTQKDVVLSDSYGELTVIERRQWGTMAVTILQRAGK